MLLIRWRTRSLWPGQLDGRRPDDDGNSDSGILNEHSDGSSTHDSESGSLASQRTDSGASCEGGGGVRRERPVGQEEETDGRRRSAGWDGLRRGRSRIGCRRGRRGRHGLCERHRRPTAAGAAAGAGRGWPTVPTRLLHGRRRPGPAAADALSTLTRLPLPVTGAGAGAGGRRPTCRRPGRCSNC